MALFELCPFTVRPSGGIGVGSISFESWTREKCLRNQCKLWTYKKDADGKQYEGCVFEFMGLDLTTMKENIEIKDSFTPHDKIIDGAMYCHKCKKAYDSSWKICMQCNTSLTKNT
jgi:hypothetical protein